MRRSWHVLCAGTRHRGCCHGVAADRTISAWCGNSALAPSLDRGLPRRRGSAAEPDRQGCPRADGHGPVGPRHALYIYQSNPDWLVPVPPVNKLVDTHCRDPSANVADLAAGHRRGGRRPVRKATRRL